MKRLSKKALGLLLVLILCISMVPMPALATADGIAPDIAADNPTDLDAENTAPEPTLQPTPEPEQPTASPMPDSTPEPTQAAEPAPQVSQQPEQAPQATDNPDPILVQTVNKPLVQVVYHYYDAAQNENVSSFEDYTIASTHSYNALAMANGDIISIAANKYPTQVPVSTEQLRFRVLLNGSEDITAQASYDAAMGAVSLPHDFMGHNITVHWYCPTSEVAELPITATISTYANGAFTNSIMDLSLVSNANIIRVPLANTIGLVVSQNGIDLPESVYSMSGGNLNISASALGGDIAVTAYAPQKAARGISTMGATTQVSHTRSADQIYYGYYTSYYTANGNTAFCLDPTVSGLSAGTYDVSGYLSRGTGYDDLIKAAYYLYGGPAYDSVKNNLFGDPDSMEAYGLCHAAVAYMWLDNPSAFMGLSSQTRDHLLRVIDSVNAQVMPPESFEVFLYNVGSNTNQSLMSWEYTPTGNLEIQKESSDPSKTDKNECYSLEGAKFDVFNGSNEKIGSITTDKNGKGKLEGIPAGSGYYLIETKPPKGYAESKVKIPFEIVSGETTIKKIKNIPQNDPIGILLKKQDAETDSDKTQGSASLEGAQFAIKYYKWYYTESELKGVTPARQWVVKTNANGFAYLNSTFLVSGDAFYFKSDGKTPTMPLGTITIQEKTAPVGYLLNDELYIRQIKPDGVVESVTTYNEPIIKEYIIRGGVSLEKWDFDLNRKAVPQGDATLAGAVLEIYNRTGSDVIVNNKTYKNNAVVHTMITDATGSAATSGDLLPYGKYEVIEKTAPTGYLNTGVIRQEFEIKKNGEVVSLKTNATAIKNNVERGGVEISKWDIERDAEKLKQGDATLEGAVLEIWNRSKSIVVVAGKEYAPNEVVHTMTTDANGWAGTANNLLPYGSYEIIEKTPPTGYLNTGVIKQSFQIRKNGEIVKLLTSDKVIKNNIIRGGARIEKWDNEIDKHHAQGGTTFEGAVFELVNRSVDSVLVLDKLYAPGEVVFTFKTDKDGVATTPNDLLPYGTYEVREIEPPEGYLHTGVLSRTFKIREHGKIVDMNTSETAIKNDPIRGDLKGVKISDGDGNRLANVPFRITSKSTGENHVIVTD
ncbi:MAG: SpaA isopeptide-forming pilin-related protein, partial [Christensenellaceae bacterium]